MASPPSTTSTRPEDKTVMGYPAQPGSHVGMAAGYPQTTAPPPSSYPIGANYAYVAAPPTNYTNTYRHSVPPHHNYHQESSTALFRLLTGFMIGIFILIVFSFVAWLIFKPRLPDFTIRSAELAPLNITGSDLSATWDISFLVKNRNDRLSIYYDQVEAWVVYGGKSFLSGIQLPRFSQDRQSETFLRAKLAMASGGVDGDLLRQISAERESGNVVFEIRVLSLVRFRRGAWTRDLMRVFCENVKFGFSSANATSGSLVGGPKSCRVALRNEGPGWHHIPT